MPNRKTVPVIIPHYKKKNELETCLEALRGQQNVITEVYVRDNTYDNILFTKAVNEGLRKYVYSELYDYVLIINQDAYLNDSTLDQLVSTLEQDKTIGIASPLQINESGEITWAGSLNSVPWGINDDNVAPFLWGRHNTVLPETAVPFDTFWANGACFLARTSMFREIGLLDENMLFIYSDVDISLTARLRNWKIMVVPTATCNHSLNSSISQEDEGLNFIKYADQLYFTFKWLSGRAFQVISYEGKNLTTESINLGIDECHHIISKLRLPDDLLGQQRLNHKVLSMLDNIRK